MYARQNSHSAVAIPKLEELQDRVNPRLAQTFSDADAMSWYQGILDVLVENIVQLGTEDVWYNIRLRFVLYQVTR